MITDNEFVTSAKWLQRLDGLDTGRTGFHLNETRPGSKSLNYREVKQPLSAIYGVYDEPACYSCEGESKWWTDDVISSVTGIARKSNHCAGSSVYYLIVSHDDKAILYQSIKQSTTLLELYTSISCAVHGSLISGARTLPPGRTMEPMEYSSRYVITEEQLVKPYLQVTYTQKGMPQRLI